MGFFKLDPALLMLGRGGVVLNNNLFYLLFRFCFVVFFFFFFFSSIGLATNYYVSSSGGDDSNSGTSEGSAWETLSRVNSFTLSPGDQILFKRGDTFYGSLTLRNSGTSGNSITYGAYGTGDKPRFIGSEVITGWSVYSGNIYQAATTNDITQVFLDGERMQLARYPNTGYFNVTTVNSTTQFQSKNLSTGIDYTGANIEGRWVLWRLMQNTITASTGNTLTLNAAPSYSISTNERFFLTNKLEFLDIAGQWYYDTSTNTVYLWTPNGDSPANYTIEGSKDDYFINASNKDYITIENLDIGQYAIKAINLDGCDYITIDGCYITDSESMGVEADNGSYITITNSLIDGSNGEGIKIDAPNSLIENNTVSNICDFDNIGLSGAGIGVAILTVSSSYSTIRYNNIKNIGFNGISFDGTNTTVQYNFIDNVCTTLNDGGAIYTYQQTAGSPGSPNSVISDNIIVNCSGETGSVTMGVYLDNNTHDVTVKNNTIASGRGGISIGNYNVNNVVENNTFYDLALISWAASDSRGSYTTTFKHNIAYITDRLTSFVWWTDQVGKIINTSNMTLTCDSNTYVSHFRKDFMFRYNGATSFKDFLSWQAQGYDTHSTIDVTALNPGQSAEIFYNKTKQTKTISLGSFVYKNLNGKEISGTITLEPFTSIILVKTSSTVAENQSPVIEGQSFNIQGIKQTGDFIGQVVASDPDAGQVLSYVITGGNTNGLFSIDAITGEIVANTDINATSDQSYVLTVQVTDNAPNPSSASAEITINVTAPAGSETPDNITPVISGFAVPSSSSSLTVPISSFVASDNYAVTGYLLTESPEIPSETGNGWSPSAPTSYTFTSEGIKTLYAWVKDAAGNISEPVSVSVLITLSGSTSSSPDLTSTYSEYLFEETSGITVFDSEGVNDGVIINEGSRAEGVNGKGLEFTGTDYISLGQVFSNNVRDEVTLSAWIKPSVTSIGWQGIIMHGGPSIGSYALYINPDSKSIGFKTTGTSNPWISADNIHELWDGEWHQITVTYNGSEKIIYLDGVAILSIESTGTIESGQGYNLYIGAGRDQEPPTLLYNGLIDEVRIYNYALTENEVFELYNLIFSIDQLQKQYIDLEEGWNIFSSYLVPTNLNMENVFEELLKNNFLIEVQDGNGHTYQKTGDNWDNNIGEFKISAGYKIKINSQCVLEINGSLIELPFEIELNEGWNIISFPYSQNIDAMEVVQPLIYAGILEKVQNEKGNSIEYWGNEIGWINGIGDFFAGEGYLVLVKEEGILPIISNFAKSAESLLEGESVLNYFRIVYDGNGFGHMNINITGLTDINLQAGDEIAVFDGDNCVGASKINITSIRNNIISIRASAANGETINGFIEGNPIELRIWDANKNNETSILMNVINGELFFHKQSSVFVQLKAKEEDIINDFELNRFVVFPNPANDKITIQFPMLPENGMEIRLIDNSGKQIFSREVHSTYEIIDIQNQPAGVYFVKILSKNNYAVRKLVVK